MDLISRIIKASEELEVRENAIEKFLPYLKALKNKDSKTLQHSARVAFLGRDIAKFTNLTSPKTLFLPGLVHDVGKLLISPELLKMTVGFDEKDLKEMSNHVEYGCKLLLGIADFSSLALFYHHYFKRKGAYPNPEDFNKIFGNYFDDWSEGTKTLAKYCGRLISLADFYDSAKTRKNDKFSPGQSRLVSGEQVKELLIKENLDQSYLIQQLYDKNIFKT